MAKTGYYDFSGGLNYRDDYISPLELRDAKNLYWDGGKLALRNGYEQRNADLTAPTGFTLIETLGQAWIKNPTYDEHFVFVSASTDASTVPDRIVPYHRSDIPTATNSAYTAVDTTAYHHSWTTADPFQIAVLDDKIYMAMGDTNPYVIYSTGTTWYCRELVVADYVNGGTTSTGAGIIVTSGADADWRGSKWVCAGETEGGACLFIGDDLTAYYGIKSAAKDPSKDIDAGTTQSIDGIDDSWAAEQYIILDPNARIWKTVSIGAHLFLLGYNGIYRLSLRGKWEDDFGFQRISDKGCWGGALAADCGVFYVGQDGIYANDSIMSYNISKKMWSEVADNHSEIDNYVDSSIQYHNGYLYISFPSATAGDVWKFDPDWIYSEGDESYAPMHRFQYTDTGGNVRGFKGLKSYELKLIGLSSQHAWEMETETLDQHSTGSGRPIQWHMRSGWDDQGTPLTEKSYTKLGIEASSAIADGTTDGNYDFQVAFSVNHSTAGNARGISTGIDMEAATGTLHVNKSLDVPLSSDGYVLDGNCGAVEIIGETSNVTTGAGDISMSIYGYTVEYQPLISPHEEVAT